MSVRVLFFGATAEAVGDRSRAVEITEAIPVGLVIDQIVTSHPDLSRYKLLFALNEEYVSRETLVSDGDRLAVFTAVSGG